MKGLRIWQEDVHEGTLLLVNRSHPMPNSVTENLTTVDEDYPGIRLDRQAAKLLTCCIEAAGGSREIVPVSGWRSFTEQRSIWDNTLREKGEDFTRSYVALPGCSEHQTGLAIDLAQKSEKIDFIRPEFPFDGVCGSFRHLAAQYGFILRYPAGKEAITGIASEPWHFRYVGTPHSLIMEDEKLCLEEYINLVREEKQIKTFKNGSVAMVYFVPCPNENAEIIPEEADYQISGNNVDGFIVTVWRLGSC